MINQSSFLCREKNNLNNEKMMLKEIAEIFKRNRPIILINWINMYSEAVEINSIESFQTLLKGIESLLDSCIEHFIRGDLKEYYSKNSILGQQMSDSDISYREFITGLQLFENSYSSILTESIDQNNISLYQFILNKIHHENLYIFSKRFFEVNDSTILAVAKMAEFRDFETGNHLRRTREYAVLLAKELGMDDKHIDHIYKAGPLHDIGKVGISDSILLKRGKLNKEEFDQMKTHTTIGAEIINKTIKHQRSINSHYNTAMDIVLYHHEKYDGNGYPKGLKGTQIPLSARIFALADAYDAIVSKRPYKEALPHRIAVERIEIDSGTHFDPEIVKVFLRIQDKFSEINKKEGTNSQV